MAGVSWHFYKLYEVTKDEATCLQKLTRLSPRGRENLKDALVEMDNTSPEQQKNTKEDACVHSIQEGEIGSEFRRVRKEAEEAVRALQEELKANNASAQEEIRANRASAQEEIKAQVASLQDQIQRNTLALEEAAALQDTVKKDVAALKSKVKKDVAALQDTVKEDVAALQHTVKEDVASLKDEVKEDVAALRKDISKIENKHEAANVKYGAKIQKETEGAYSLVHKLQAAPSKPEENEVAVKPPVEFNASLSRDISSPISWNTIKFDDVHLNVGRGYDARTGVFTAPYEGNYVFTVCIKGDLWEEFFSPAFAMTLNSNQWKSWSLLDEHTIQEEMQLKFGDKISVEVSGYVASSLPGSLTAFGGFLML